MRARNVIVLLALIGGSLASAGEPKPQPIDIKAFKDKLIVLEDPQGGIYVVLAAATVNDMRLWYGTDKSLYEQVIRNRSWDGSAGTWDLAAWAPRVPHVQPGSVMKKDDGTFHRWCGDDRDTPLKQVTADRAKAVIAKSAFLTPAMTRSAHLLARDDAGIYYYVDVIRAQYGGSGYRVFVGKKGAMKELPLSDVASDTGGEVFSTKSGDVRIVRDQSDADKATVTWVKGEKRTALVKLDIEANSRVIFKDLNVYPFLGTICEDL